MARFGLMSKETKVPDVFLDELAEGAQIYMEPFDCCGIAPEYEFLVHSLHEPQCDDMYSRMRIEEHGNTTCAFCFPGSRATTYEVVHTGASASCQVLFSHQKDLTCSVCPSIIPCLCCVKIPWCCCLPYLTTKDENGHVLGSTEMNCNPCRSSVPYFVVKDASGEPIYDFQYNFLCCCPVPSDDFPCVNTETLFEFRNCRTDQYSGGITELKSGVANMCFKRHFYSINFPTDIQGPNRGSLRKTLLGALMLLHLAVREPA